MELNLHHWKIPRRHAFDPGASRVYDVFGRERKYSTLEIINTQHYHALSQKQHITGDRGQIVQAEGKSKRAGEKVEEGKLGVGGGGSSI